MTPLPPQVCHLLLAQLHDLLDPTIEGHAQHGHLRVVQRASRTVLRKFHPQLGAKCGAFIEVLLSGEGTELTDSPRRHCLAGMPHQASSKLSANILVLTSSHAHAGTATTCALWQRASSMQTVRQLCDDPALLHHLFISCVCLPFGSWYRVFSLGLLPWCSCVMMQKD